MTSASGFHFKNALKQESFSIEHESKVLLHCPEGVQLKSISSIEEASFSKEVHDELHSLRSGIGYIDLYRTQAVGWPHLMRGYSLILVNSAKTRKTWTYLPAICSLLGEAHDDDKILKVDGPVMIIICMDSSEAERVLQNCHNFLKRNNLNKNFSYMAAHGRCEEDKSILSHLLNGIDILVTTIPCLLRLMKNPLKLFNKNRVTTIVFDEIDSMCDRFGLGNVDLIYKEFCADPRIQFIVTSKTWHKVLNKFCRKNDVLLCIGAYIEAAIYSKVDISLQFTNKDDLNYHNNQFLSHFNSKNYTHEPTVIMCTNFEEVLEVSNLLRREGVAITSCHEKSDSSNIDSINNRIHRNHTEELGVLICADDVLSDLNVRNAQHIIHYSLPSLWTTFTFRFIASFDYYANLVQDSLSAGRPTSVVFVDENNYDSFPRLIEFMRTRCFTDVPTDILKLAEKKRIEREESRLTQNKNFCANLLSIGVCHSQYRCTSRHTLTRFDRPLDTVPRNGHIKFKIIATHSPIHFTVHLMEHRSLTRNQWRKIPYSDDWYAFEMKLVNYFKDSSNHKIHHPPELDDLCVVIDDADKYKRCKIININNTRSEIDVLLIDTNEVITIWEYIDLLVLPDQFKEFPAQAVDIRIGGIVPLDSEIRWDKKSTQLVKKWLEHAENCYIEAKIELALMNCIWVKSVEITKILRSINEETRWISITEKLIQKNIGVADSKPLDMLREMAERAGILDLQPYMIEMDATPTDQACDVLESETNESPTVLVQHSKTQKSNETIPIPADSLKTSNLDVDDGDNYESDNDYDSMSNRSEEESKLDFLNWDNVGSDEDFDIDVQFDEEDFKKLLAAMGVSPPVIEEIKKTEEISPGPPSIKYKKKIVPNIHNKLVDSAKMPYVIWEQADETITLAISAPDVTEYYLKVGLRHIHFSFVNGNERFENILNLFGCVDVEHTSHEIRGLNIIVRLMKTLPGLNWPRLIQSPDKNRFIKYKFIANDLHSNDDEPDHCYSYSNHTNYSDCSETYNDDDYDTDSDL